MEVIGTLWLYADKNSPGQTAQAFGTIDRIPKGTNVLATIALSYFSEGVSPDQGVGVAGALIRRWDVFNPDGTITTVENTDFAGNSKVIDNCASVTFELSIKYARAYAQASVFSL